MSAPWAAPDAECSHPGQHSIPIRCGSYPLVAGQRGVHGFEGAVLVAAGGGGRARQFLVSEVLPRTAASGSEILRCRTDLVGGAGHHAMYQGRHRLGTVGGCAGSKIVVDLSGKLPV